MAQWSRRGHTGGRSEKGPREAEPVACRAGESAEGRTRPERQAPASARGGGSATGAARRRVGECGLQADGGGSRAAVANGAAADAGRAPWCVLQGKGRRSAEARAALKLPAKCTADRPG